MKAFAELYAALDSTTRTNAKLAALAQYFSRASAADSAYALVFLSGHKPRQLVPTARLWKWAGEMAPLPEWLLGECYDAVGDLAEMITLILPEPTTFSELLLHEWIEEHLYPLRNMDEAEQKAQVLAAWKELDQSQRLIYHKIILGSFRVGVSQRLVTRAIAQVSGIADAVIAHRLMGHWTPSAQAYLRLIDADTADAEKTRPFPFFLAHPLEDDITSLGDVSDWQAEWKWDGLRAQLVRRAGGSWLWTRGEELVSERYPEITDMSAALPDGTVVDGEVLPWRDGQPLGFAALQRRIGRKGMTAKLLREIPVVLMAYDLLEWQGQDIRKRPLRERRKLLDEIIEKTANPRLLSSPILSGDVWETLAGMRARSRERRVEGIMLKRKNSPYRVGRQRGDWWKWKIEPYTIDAVLVYAQPGSGRRAGLHTDYTFALWDDGELVPFAKAYSGLSNKEIHEVDKFVHRNTIEKFGPVRHVTPELVFELGFEAIAESTRHRCGIAVRFPRILRWRRDKKTSDADRIETLRSLIPKPDRKVQENVQLTMFE